MTGLPDYNKQAFRRAADDLAHRGYAVVNPRDNFAGDASLKWTTYLRLALSQVASADEVCLLPDWEDSPGARLEAAVGVACGKHVWEYESGDSMAEVAGAKQARDIVEFILGGGL